MTRNAWALPTTCLALVAGFAIDGGGVRAQQTNTTEEITIVAPRLVTRPQPAGLAPAGKVELISLTRRVAYSDLNLALHNDVMALEKRVNDVAKDACETLAKMYPMSDPNTPNCTEQAIKDAKLQIDRVVAAAAKK
jgi:UrcA family protein